MPMQYDPDTGMPSYVPDFGAEIEEGQTPKATVISSKSDVFKGDKRLTKEGYEALRDGMPKGTVEDIDMADRMLNEAIRNARPASLDANVATDSEIEEVERLANEHSVLHWPLLLRLINRLRRAEAR
jgi:hypothetical protein